MRNNKAKTRGYNSIFHLQLSIQGRRGFYYQSLSVKCSFIKIIILPQCYVNGLLEMHKNGLLDYIKEKYQKGFYIYLAYAASGPQA